MTRVLLVEDEESFSDARSYLRRKVGFQVAVCPAGPDALAMFGRDGATWCCPASCSPGQRAPTCAGACAKGRMCR
jgi:hypothetical protein